MFAVGDMHAAMGDGEICGTGVEIAGEVVARFELVKGKQATWPVTELPNAWVTHATAGALWLALGGLTGLQWPCEAVATGARSPAGVRALFLEHAELELVSAPPRC